MVFATEKQIFINSEHKEVEISSMTEGRRRFYSRSERHKRENLSSPAQKSLNDKNARIYFRRLVNTNFGKKDLHVSLTYENEYLPASIDDGEKIAEIFIRRLKRLYDKLKVTLRYVLVNSFCSGKNGAPVRMHHHIICSGGVSLDAIRALWYPVNARSKKDKEKLMGYCNIDPLQPNNNWLDAIVSYLFKQPRESLSRRWRGSLNLKKPQVSKPDDYKYSYKQLKNIVVNNQFFPDVRFWEKNYPGWTVEPNFDYTYSAGVDMCGGYHVRIKLMKIPLERRIALIGVMLFAIKKYSGKVLA